MPKERIIWIQFVTLSTHFANEKDQHQPITARLKRSSKGIQSYQRKKI
jgi:chloramphenicol O-acetyltransferase